MVANFMTMKTQQALVNQNYLPENFRDKGGCNYAVIPGALSINILLLVGLKQQI